MHKNKKGHRNQSGAAANSLWGGRFSAKPAEIMQAINASIFFDCKLYRQDIRASKAHAEMLGARGIIAKGDVKKIIVGLNKVEKEIEKGEFAFDPTLEDIHMHVEARLSELIGPIAGKLHTARSRNDQVVTDFRLWVRDAIDQIDIALKDFQKALLDQAEMHFDTILPGFTHLQTAQPVVLGHHLMAYVEMAGRDRSRFQDCRARLNESPLGAAALAGTPFPIDRKMTAKVLGFDRIMKNSMDAVSDRDFALEYLSAIAIAATHLSRLAEEMIIWASAAFHFINLSDQLSTGSSIMPQKRNPDAAELTRAKTGRINGSLIALLTVMKGLPLAYSKDMQEDKEPVFDATDSFSLCLIAMTAMIAGFDVNKASMLDAARDGYSTATDFADWLVRELALPFREAHHITGRIVKRAEKKGCLLDELPLSDMQVVEGRIHVGIYSVLSVENSVKSRKSLGGTSPARVRAAIRVARKEYL